jgi:tellurium resistance protein TerD
MSALKMEKGERVDITKENPSLKNLGVGLGWDVKASGGAADLDSFVLLLNNGKLVGGTSGVVYFNNKTQTGVKHEGDNLTGAGDGDDETINIDLSQVTADEIMIGVNIYKASERNQKFGQVNNAFVRLYDKDTKKELAKFDLSEDKSTDTGMILGRLYKKDGEWKFQAVGEGKAGEIDAFAAPYL